MVFADAYCRSILKYDSPKLSKIAAALWCKKNVLNPKTKPAGDKTGEMTFALGPKPVGKNEFTDFMVAFFVGRKKEEVIKSLDGTSWSTDTKRKAYEISLRMQKDGLNGKAWPTTSTPAQATFIDDFLLFFQRMGVAEPASLELKTAEVRCMPSIGFSAERIVLVIQ